MSDKLKIPDDLTQYYDDAKRRAAGRLSLEVQLIERIAKSEARVIALERALREMLKYCPLSGDLAVMVRCMQGGGEDAQARADRLVDHYQHLDAAQDNARAALNAE